MLVGSGTRKMPLGRRNEHQTRAVSGSPRQDQEDSRHRGDADHDVPRSHQKFGTILWLKNFDPSCINSGKLFPTSLIWRLNEQEVVARPGAFISSGDRGSLSVDQHRSMEWQGSGPRFTAVDWHDGDGRLHFGMGATFAAQGHTLVMARGFFNGVQAHINVCELQAVRLAIESFLPKAWGTHTTPHRIRLRVDNQVVMYVLRSLTTLSLDLMMELQSPFYLCKSRNLLLEQEYIPSVDKVILDRLSRSPNEDDYRLAPQIFHRIQAEIGTRTIDRFASAKDRQLPQYNSLDWGINTEGVDAFTQNWEGELNWCSPPLGPSATTHQVFIRPAQCISRCIGPGVATLDLVCITQLASHEEHPYTPPRRVVHSRSPRDGDATSSLQMGSLGLSCDSLRSEESPDHAKPRAVLSPEPERVPPEVIPNDHPLFGLDVDVLTLTNRTWIQVQFLDFYSKSTRTTMAAKFNRFARLCEDHDLPALPAHRSIAYWYIRFLREEGSIAVTSLPQYLAAISMVQQSRGFLGFSVFDSATRRLAQA